MTSASSAIAMLQTRLALALRHHQAAWPIINNGGQLRRILQNWGRNFERAIKPFSVAAASLTEPHGSTSRQPVPNDVSQAACKPRASATRACGSSIAAANGGRASTTQCPLQRGPSAFFEANTSLLEASPQSRPVGRRFFVASFTWNLRFRWNLKKASDDHRWLAPWLRSIQITLDREGDAAARLNSPAPHRPVGGRRVNPTAMKASTSPVIWRGGAIAQRRIDTIGKL
jgi:hypothetical protein